MVMGIWYCCDLLFLPYIRDLDQNHVFFFYLLLEISQIACAYLDCHRQSLRLFIPSSLCFTSALNIAKFAIHLIFPSTMRTSNTLLAFLLPLLLSGLSLPQKLQSHCQICTAVNGSNTAKTMPFDKPEYRSVDTRSTPALPVLPPAGRPSAKVITVKIARRMPARRPDVELDVPVPAMTLPAPASGGTEVEQLSIQSTTSLPIPPGKHVDDDDANMGGPNSASSSSPSSSLSSATASAATATAPASQTSSLPSAEKMVTSILHLIFTLLMLINVNMTWRIHGENSPHSNSFVLSF